MPDGTKPAFNPNQSFSPVVENKPAFNPAEQYTVEVPKKNEYYDFVQGQENLSKFNDIVQNIPDLDDDKKETIKDLALKGVKGPELSDAILTLQGKHPHQESSSSPKYYIDDKGLPKPLRNNERPPVGYEVSSIWGSQKSANDDAWYTDLAKTVYNILPSSAENVVDLAQTGYEGVTGKESEWLNTLKNSANYLKFAKDEDLNKSLFNTQGIDEWSDLLDTKRLDFSPEAIWGTVNGLLGTVGEFAVGGSGVGKVVKGIKGVEELSKTQSLVSNMMGSTLVNLGEVRDAATAAGLEGRDRALLTAVVAPIISAVDVKWGLGTKMFGNVAATEEKKAFLTALGKAIPRDAEGKITKEGIDELAKVTTVGYTQVAKKLGQLTTQDVLAEGGQEALQQFIQNASEQLWDKLTPEEKKKFGTDAFSPESFAEYIQNGMAGLIGGTPTVFAYNKAKALAKQEEQDKSAFEIAKGGDESIKNFTQNVDQAVKQGNMTKDEADNALFKVMAYKNYWENTKETKLNDEDKRKVFGLTFEKANLENQIPTDYEEEKLNAIEQAKINVKKKQAKDIQDEINKIFLADELLRKETHAAKKTVEDVHNHLTPKETKEGEEKTPETVRDLIEKYSKELTTLKTEPHKKEEPETREFEAIPALDWNSKRDSSKFKVLSEHLDKSNTFQVGELQLMKGGEGQSTNDTVHIKLPNDKWVIMASSATNLQTKNRGYLHIENLPEDFNGHRVVIKPTRLTTGRLVLPVYNAETGKHVGYVREDDMGKANEKLLAQRAKKVGEEEAAKMADKETEELQHLKTVKLTKNEIEAIQTGLTGENKSGIEVITHENKTAQPKEEKIVEPISKEEFIAHNIERLKQDEGADYDSSLEQTYKNIFAKQYEQRHATEGVATSQEKSTTGNIEEISGKSKETSIKKTFRKGIPRAKQKIKNPIRIKALEIESTNPYDLTLQYFIKNGMISRPDLAKFFNNDQKEINNRWGLWSNNAPTRQQIAHDLWEANSHLNRDTGDFLNAVEEVLRNFEKRDEMARDLISRWEIKVDPKEQVISDELDKADNQGVYEETQSIVEEAEKLGNDEISKLANNQNEFDIWGEKIIPIVIKKEDEKDVFQKEAIPGAERAPQDVNRVMEAMQRAMPNMNIVYDEKLDAAGVLKADRKTIAINPYHAGIDTPIHEAGHVLIELMGGNNNHVIRNAIKQLQNTLLWRTTKHLYPELDEEELGYEVLAEAIGREGADIFDTEIEKSRFMAYLEYIFDWLKRNLGLEKNIAKNLAKQIIAGIGTKKMIKIEGEEQLSKRSFKKFEDKTKEEKIKALTLSFEQYSRQVLKRDVVGESENLKRINDALENPDLDEVQIDQLNQIKNAIETRRKNDLKQWFDYREDMKWAASLDDNIRELDNQAQKGEINEQEYLDGLVELYNVVNGFQQSAKETVEANIKNKLAYALFRLGKDTLKKNEKFVEEIANKADISVKDVWLKNLGHMTEKVPELQVFGKIFDEASFDKVAEAKEKKNTFEKLGTAVIKEVNKELGIGKKLWSLFSSDSAQYFTWMDKDGELLTEAEAIKQGLSDAKINFLKYYRELIAEHQGLINDDSIYNMPLEVLKTDPSFKESYKQEGITQAFSNFLGTSYNLKQVRILFKNPNTNREEITEFANVESALIEYGKKGPIEKAKVLALLLKYNRNARAQLKKGVNIDEKENPLLIKNNSQYSVDNKGILSSKFDKPRDKSRGYSKDFYRAGIEFIDDMTHVKHMSKLVPLINGIEHLNKEGYEEHLDKPNVVKWIQEWRDLHLFKNPKQTIPELDAALRFLRGFTSATTMLFNVPAGVMNLAMGLYNNYRAQTDAWRAKGHKRLFAKGARKLNKDYAYGSINPYAIDILRKYNVVSTDIDSNPKLSVFKVFDALGHALTKYGEFQIQGTNFLGQMSDEEYNSFEYKKNKQGIDELVVKEGVDEKALKKKLIEYKKRVSDIQGKYGDSDKRNIMNNELGKAAFQFKVWMPDWWKERFGERYIDRNGNVKQGSWRVFVGDGLQELKNEINEKGTVKAFWENKDFMSNLKGAMFTVMFMVLAYQDDDDKKRNKAALDADNALSQLLFIFDPQQVKFTIERPIAAVGTISKFLDATQHLLDLDADKLEKDLIKLTPANKALKVTEIFE